MPTLWVPVVAAAIGAISALVINGLTRRSERKREELRWERELQRQADERAHEERLHWRSERLDVYRRFLLTLTQWHKSLSSASSLLEQGEHISAGIRTRITSAKRETEECYALIVIVGSDDMRHRLPATLYTFDDVTHDVLELDQPCPAGHLWTELNSITDAVRAELGVDDRGTTAPPVNPPPPDPTS